MIVPMDQVTLKKQIPSGLFCEYIYGLTQKPQHTVHISWLQHFAHCCYIWRVSVESDQWNDKTFPQMTKSLTCLCFWQTVTHYTFCTVHLERNSSLVACFHLRIQRSTKHWWFNKKAQLGLFLLPCQSCGRKKQLSSTHSLKFPKGKKNKTPYLYRLYTCQMMHRKWKGVKQK